MPIGCMFDSNLYAMTCLKICTNHIPSVDNCVRATYSVQSDVHWQVAGGFAPWQHTNDHAITDVSVRTQIHVWLC